MIKYDKNMNMENGIIDNESKLDGDKITTKEKLELFSSEMNHYGIFIDID
jgi:hypothetical protein